MALPIQQNTFKPRYHVDQTNATAASYMTQNYMTLPEHISVAEAKKVFLEKLEENSITNQIFITTNDKLMSILSVKSLLKYPNESDSINQLMQPNFFFVAPGDKRTELAKSLHDCGFDLVPVLDKGLLVGALSEREIDRILEDDSTEDAQLQGGSLPLDKPYLQMTPFALWKKRSVWLLLLFIAEAYTSTVIKSFEDQLEAVIALAFFIPLLVGTGGNSGTQITSTIVRSMAIGELSINHIWQILRKEMSTAVLIAITLGAAGILRASFMNIGWDICIVVSLSLVCITLWSAIVSSVIPLLLKRCGIDPAVVSAPFITTLVDGTGLIIYFEIAKVILNI